MGASRREWRETKSVIIDATVNDCIEESTRRRALEHFALLPLRIQKGCVERVVKAQARVNKLAVINRESIILPYIGKVSIKHGKKIEIEVLDKIAKTLGYEDISEVGLEEYEELRLKNKSVISEKFIQNRKVRNNNRKGFTSAKIGLFDLNKARKT